MDTFITKEDSKKLKGIAIIMMVAMHIFKISWVDNPESILDISVRGGVPVSCTS